jgi:hypothetical protein
MLGKAGYPSLEAVEDEIKKAGGVITRADDGDLPIYDGKTVRANIFVLGMLLANPRLSAIIGEADVVSELETRWPKAAKLNVFTLKAGLTAAAKAKG